MHVEEEKLYMVDNPTLGPTTYAKRLVFLDTDNLTEWGLGIYQRFPQPEISPLYGLECGPADSWDARQSAGYGSVLYEDGRYRRWSCAMPGIKSYEETADTWLSAYAESEDGIHWVKPDLQLVGQQRWPGNNLLNIPGGLYTVVRPLPGTGWKYVALAVKCGPPLPGVFASDDIEYNRKYIEQFTEGGHYLYGSDDGIHWQQITKNPVLHHGDVGWLHVDPVQQRYLLYFKCAINHGMSMRRSEFVVESKDLIHWQGYNGYRQWHESFHCDDYDDLIAMQHGLRIGEFNSMAFHQIDSLYISVQAFFMVGLPLVNRANQNPAGVFVMRLAYSHDGLIWRYPQGRPFFTEVAPPGDYGSYLCTASHLLDIGDETRLDFISYKRNHMYGIDKNMSLDTSIPPEAHNGLCRPFVLKMKRDRYASLASTYKDTFDVEIGPRQGKKLTFNAITRGGGTVRIAIAEQSCPLHLEPRKGDSLPGFSFDDCLPFSGDDVRAEVRFRKKSITEIPEDMALILRVELDGAEIFGYEWHD